MRTLLFAILGVTLIGGGSANTWAQGQTAYMEIACYPAKFIEDAMITQGLTNLQRGAFDDGDLLLVYRNEAGQFVAGFASAKGGVCILGSGSGLEHDKLEPEGSKS